MYALTTGQSIVMNQNEVYALPSGQNFVTSSLAVDQSVDNTTWTALTGANTTGVNCGAKYLRCTTGAPTVRCVKSGQPAPGSSAAYVAAGYVTVGPNPAQRCGIRLTVDYKIRWRAPGGASDFEGMCLSSAFNLSVGDNNTNVSLQSSSPVQIPAGVRLG